MTKTEEEDLDKELLDHLLTDPGNNTLHRYLVVKSLTAAVVSVLCRQAQELTQVRTLSHSPGLSLKYEAGGWSNCVSDLG